MDTLSTPSTNDTSNRPTCSHAANDVHFKCPMCSYSCLHFRTMLKHYEYVHNYDRNLQISCGVSGCSRMYRSVRCLKRHMQHYHPEIFKYSDFSGQEVEEGSDLNYLNLGDQEYDPDIVNTDEAANSDQLVPLQNGVSSFDYEKRMVSFLLTLRHKNKVTQSASDAIAHEVGLLITLSNELLLQNVQQGLEPGSFLHENYADILAQHNKLTSNICEGLSSSRKLNSYVKRHMTFIEPIPCSLNGDGPVDGNAMQYIPILETLKALLSHEDVLGQVLDDRRSSNGFIRDFCDGSVFKQNRLFQQHPNSLQIQLYNDDFSCTNPLRNRNKKHKISAVYFLLGNLSPKYRSTLNAIQLVSLCPQPLLKEHGIAKMLQPLIDDLKILETEGINVSVDGSNYHFFGTVSFVAADNLAAHGIGGFFQNFSSALRLCRFCNATKGLMAESFDEDSFQLRTPRSYDAQAELVQENKVLATTYGMRSKSPLNQLSFFHVCDGLPADIAHDLFEGFVPESLELVLLSLVRKRYFSIADLNDVISDFDYAVVDRANKPSPVVLHGTTPKLRLTQSQMWTFARLLPLFIGDRVPQVNCEDWKFCLKLLDYIEHVCAPAFDLADLAHLKDITEYLHDTFCTLYGATVKPKRHFSIHYPTLIRKFGPLRHCWTLRFEGKHQYYKDLFNRTKNRKNTCKSLAEMNQQHQALQLDTPFYLNANVVDSTFLGEISPQKLPENVQDLVTSHLGTLPEKVIKADKIVVAGSTYAVGTVALLAFEHDTYLFGEIQYILSLRGSFFLCCKKMTTMEYSAHFHAYVLDDMEHDDWSLVEPSQLLDHQVLGMYSIHNEKAVVMKYHIDPMCNL